jgi:hypothetical protein
MKSFSDYAKEKLLNLYKNHSHEVGSQLKKLNLDKYSSYESTDCITYVLNVISFAFKNIGDTDAAKRSWHLGSHGTKLAEYLVRNHNWKGIYVNPDINHPLDADMEHVFSNHIASKQCKYYNIPLEYKVTNYSITSKTNSAFRKLNKKKVTALDTINISSLELIKFGFGVSRGGKHTWLFSEGYVYEVHWDSIDPGLYEATSLRNFEWLSGAIVVPYDQAALLIASSKLKCG